MLVFTIQVPLGVLTKSEQKGDDMIDILMHIHKYVPQKRDGDFAQIFLGGDQLTRERAGSAVDARLLGRPIPVTLSFTAYK